MLQQTAELFPGYEAEVLQLYLPNPINLLPLHQLRVSC
jgi:hypothetical protein